MPETEKLEQEMAVYEKNLENWIDREGLYVLIQGSDVCGFFEDYVEAVREGYARFGIAPFLVKQVRRRPQVQAVTRFDTPRLAR